MAENKIKLEKNVISNQQAQDQADSLFNEVIISAERIDDDKLKKIYEDLFYKIPQRGNLSHETIVIKSDDVVHPETNINLEGEISILEQDLLEKYDELNSLEAPEKEHAIFSNNTFIQEGDPGQDITTGSTVWYVQKGLKRIISGDNYINLLREINGDMVFNANGQHIPVENSPLRQLGKADEINSILEAQDIKHGEDFSVEPVAKEHQNHLYDQFKVEFECFGQERYYAFSDEEREALEDFGGLDTFTVTISSDWVYSDGSNYKHGYWYLDKNGQCTVTYVNDVDPTIGFTPEETTVTLGVPGYIKRSISRDASIYSGDPFSAAYYETPTRLEWRVRPPDAFNPIYPTMPYNKEWGPGGKFPSITHVSNGSRVKVKIVNKRDDGSPIYPRESNPDAEEWTELQGLDEDHHDDWVSIYGEPMGLFNFFSRKSKWDTKMCNNVCYGPAANDCYGRLNQNWRREDDDINKRLMKIFSDRDNPYYAESWGYNIWLRGKLYGQPILYVNKKLMVYMGGRRRWSWGVAIDENYFFDLERSGNHFYKVKNSDLESKVLGYKRQSVNYDAGPNLEYLEVLNPPHKQFFQWINPNRNWDGTIRGSLNNPTLIFPGLALGHGLNGAGGPVGSILNEDYSNGQQFTDLNAGDEYLDGGWDFVSDTLRGLSSGYTRENVTQYNLFNPGTDDAAYNEFGIMSIQNEGAPSTIFSPVGQGSNIGMTQWMVDNLDFHNPFDASVPPGEEMFIVNLNAS